MRTTRFNDHLYGGGGGVCLGGAIACWDTHPFCEQNDRQV